MPFTTPGDAHGCVPSSGGLLDFVPMRQGEGPVLIYHPWFSGHGCALLADELDADDPLCLAPGGTVDVVVKAGFTPTVDSPPPIRSAA